MSQLDPSAEPTLADLVAAAVRAVPGVVDLHPGLFGEIGTYLPGRKVPGVRLGVNGTEVHVVLGWGTPIPQAARAIRSAVSAVVSGQVVVTVEDVASPAVTAERTAL